MDKIEVTVKPRSKKEGVEEIDGKFIVRVNTPPIEGRANKRVIELLSKFLGIPKSSLTLFRGEKSKEKTFIIEEV